jgi:hypothetical protein
MQIQLNEYQETMGKKNSTRHRNNSMNSERISTNSKMKPRRVLKREREK